MWIIQLHKHTLKKRLSSRLTCCFFTCLMQVQNWALYLVTLPHNCTKHQVSSLAPLAFCQHFSILCIWTTNLPLGERWQIFLVFTGNSTCMNHGTWNTLQILLAIQFAACFYCLKYSLCPLQRTLLIRKKNVRCSRSMQYPTGVGGGKEVYERKSANFDQYCT